MVGEGTGKGEKILTTPLFVLSTVAHLTCKVSHEDMKFSHLEKYCIKLILSL